MFDLLGERILGEVYSSQFVVVGQRIDDQLRVRSGCGPVDDIQSDMMATNCFCSKETD